MDEGEEAGGGFIVAGCDAARVLELVEETLDAVAYSVEQWIDRALNLAIALCRDDRIGAVEPRVLANGVAVIASVGEQRLGAIIVGLHQRIIGRCIMRFARREDEAERQTFAVGAGVNFARKAAARTAKSLFLSPPFAPAA